MDSHGDEHRRKLVQAHVFGIGTRGLIVKSYLVPALQVNWDRQASAF